MTKEHVAVETTVSNEENSKEDTMIENEYTLLKQELKYLKDCQVRFLTFSIIGTGLILGWVSEKKDSSLWLLPLTVLLPFWWIFFNEASSITRIVGYLRVIEKKPSSDYMWETALAKYRKKESEEKEGILKKIFKLIFLQLIFLRVGADYWFTVYCTFLSLSSFCILITWFNVGKSTIFIIAFGLFVISAIRNGYYLWATACGEYSCDSRVCCKNLTIFLK